MSENKNIDAIILAAGLSSRMGIPKALLDFNGFNFLINITLKLSSICGRIVVVTGHQSELVERTYLDEIKSKINEINFAFDISETVLGKNYLKNFIYKKLRI